VFLYTFKRKYVAVTLIPAILMTLVTTSYILIAPEGLRLPYNIGLIIASVVALALVGIFIYKTRKLNK
jgi:hypothetical protein